VVFILLCKETLASLRKKERKRAISASRGEAEMAQKGTLSTTRGTFLRICRIHVNLDTSLDTVRGSSAMQQITPLSYQSVRQAQINPRHWYVVARSQEVGQGAGAKPLGITLWHQAIVLFRDSSGQVQALEDRCPHRQVKLSHGKVTGDQLECAYHGWCFDGTGACVAVPYLTERQKLPSARLRRYPVIEQDGFIWLFPGDRLSDGPSDEPSNGPSEIPEGSDESAHTGPLVGPLTDPLGLPEWDHLNYIATVSTIECNAHFSFLLENLMDMYHGHLHQNYQAWADPVLQNLTETDLRVDAHYQAQSYYKIDRIWSISQLFIPALRQLHPEPLDVSYIYPHWKAELGNDFKIYCLVCPIHETATKAYLIHFTSLNAFDKLHKLPLWFRRFLKNRLFGSAQRILDGLVQQDVQMIEEEQQAFLRNPDQRTHELNRTISSVQRLIRQQGEG
jgi:renierapurpurin 18,18'-hydroxylase